MDWRQIGRGVALAAGLTGLYTLGPSLVHTKTSASPQPVPEQAAPVAYEETAANQKLEQLERAVKEFRNKDGGLVVADTNLCLQPGATIGIVHIRQLHYEPPVHYQKARQEITNEVDKYVTLNMIMEDEYEWINKVQRDVHDILINLAASQGLRQFHNEGFPHEPTQGELFAAYLSPLQDLVSADYFNPQEARYVAFLKEQFFPQSTTPVASMEPPEHWGESLYIPGGDLVAAARADLRVLPAENHAYIDYLMQFGRDVPDAVATDYREDVLLDILTRGDSDLAVVVLGGAHALGGERSCPGVDLRDRKSAVDNVDVWNQRSQGNDALAGRFPPVSLLEITPLTYDHGALSVALDRCDLKKVQGIEDKDCPQESQSPEAEAQDRP